MWLPFLITLIRTGRGLSRNASSSRLASTALSSTNKTCIGPPCEEISGTGSPIYVAVVKPTRSRPIRERRCRKKHTCGEDSFSTHWAGYKSAGFSLYVAHLHGLQHGGTDKRLRWPYVCIFH